MSHHAHFPLPETPDGPRAATYVVDTNVILVANGQHEHVSVACQQRCAHWLQGLMAQGRIALDSGFEILREYQHKTQLQALPDAMPPTGEAVKDRVGDAFVRWALHHVNDAARCDLIDLEPDASKGWRSFPDDPRLAHFDPSDRKFVAVAALHPERPPILQAADSKWLDWRGALAEHGVAVQMLCEPEMQQFHLHKFGV